MDDGHPERWIPATPANLAKVDQNVQEARGTIEMLVDTYRKFEAHTPNDKLRAIMQLTSVILDYPGSLAPYLATAVRMLAEHTCADDPWI